MLPIPTGVRLKISSEPLPVGLGTISAVNAPPPLAALEEPTTAAPLSVPPNVCSGESVPTIAPEGNSPVVTPIEKAPGFERMAFMIVGETGIVRSSTPLVNVLLTSVKGRKTLLKVPPVVPRNRPAPVTFVPIPPTLMLTRS